MNGHMRYDVGGGLTAIAEDLIPRLSGLPSTPVELCTVVQALVVLPDLADGFGIPEERDDEKSIRAASDIIRAICALDDGLHEAAIADLYATEDLAVPEAMLSSR